MDELLTELFIARAMREMAVDRCVHQLNILKERLEASLPYDNYRMDGSPNAFICEVGDSMGAFALVHNEFVTLRRREELYAGKLSRCVAELKKDGIDEKNCDALCAICMELCEKKSVQTLCAHTFHEECLRTWLDRCDKCPLCRTDNPLALKKRSFSIVELLRDVFHYDEASRALIRRLPAEARYRTGDAQISSILISGRDAMFFDDDTEIVEFEEERIPQPPRLERQSGNSVMNDLDAWRRAFTPEVLIPEVRRNISRFFFDEEEHVEPETQQELEHDMAFSESILARIIDFL